MQLRCKGKVSLPVFHNDETSPRMRFDVGIIKVKRDPDQEPPFIHTELEVIEYGESCRRGEQQHLFEVDDEPTAERRSPYRGPGKLKVACSISVPSRDLYPFDLKEFLEKIVRDSSFMPKRIEPDCKVDDATIRTKSAITSTWSATVARPLPTPGS